MMKEFYIELKKQILYYLPEVKTVAIWNNQFNRSNGTGTDGRKEKPFNYPAVFIEFNNFNYRQLGVGVQEYDFNLVLHFGWKSFETEDLKQLDMLEKLYWVVQRFQGTKPPSPTSQFARLSRISEVWDTDRTDIGITTITYNGYSKDFQRYIFGDPAAFDTITGVTLSVSATTADQIGYVDSSQVFSGATDDNGYNAWQGSSGLTECNC